MPVNPGYGPPFVGPIRPSGRPTANGTPIGGLPPAVTVIPWTWLRTPLELRTDQPINAVTVTRTGGAAATSTNTTSQGTYGTFSASGSVDTASPDDAANLAAFLTTYYANPLLRSPLLTIPLIPRLDSERATVLAREIGDRITLGPGTFQDFPGHTTLIPVPQGLPAGSQSLVIEGIHHVVAVDNWVVEWTTAPLLGAAPGSEGPWFRLDTSVLGSNDQIPF